MKKQLFYLFLLFAFFVSVSAQTKEVEKIEELENPLCEEYLARFDNAIRAAIHNPTAKIYVFVYEGKVINYEDGKDGIQLISPQLGEAKATIRSMKKRLSIMGFLDERWFFIEGGFRKNFTVEAWLVPEGIMPPKPTPTLMKMKYRKGKPKGLCTGCC